MNSLSWFIYLADVVSSLKSAMEGIVFFSCLTCGFGLIPLIGFHLDSDFFHLREAVKKIYVVAFCVLIVSGLLNILIPSKNTLLLIAGSEISEKVAKTPEAQQILGEVKDVINNKLKDLAK